jgi:hypothetical protein
MPRVRHEATVTIPYSVAISAMHALAESKATGARQACDALTEAMWVSRRPDFRARWKRRIRRWARTISCAYTPAARCWAVLGYAMLIAWLLYCAAGFR